jgi:hypothetical protein
MVQHDIAALETQLATLDQDTAQRVTRLVVECSVSLDLALLAVQEADRCVQTEDSTPRQKKGVGRRAALWGVMSKRAG